MSLNPDQNAVLTNLAGCVANLQTLIANCQGASVVLAAHGCTVAKADVDACTVAAQAQLVVLQKDMSLESEFGNLT